MARRELPRRPFKKQDRILRSKSVRSPKKLLKPVSNDRANVLQSIEFVLVTRFREDAGMDDRAASDALRACLSDADPIESRIAELVEGLLVIREFRTEVSDEIWRDALRVIDNSVHRHSQRAAGETNYLTFAAQFVKE